MWHFLFPPPAAGVPLWIRAVDLNTVTSLQKTAKPHIRSAGGPEGAEGGSSLTSCPAEMKVNHSEV